MSQVFLSYSRVDAIRVEAVARKLIESGFELWWDRDLPPGTSYRNEIARQLDVASCVVVFWSRDSVRSDWVIDEADEGKRRGVLVQVVLDRVQPPHGFRQHNWADFTSWNGESDSAEFSALRIGISRYAATSAPATSPATESNMKGAVPAAGHLAPAVRDAPSALWNRVKQKIRGLPSIQKGIAVALFLMLATALALLSSGLLHWPFRINHLAPEPSPPARSSEGSRAMPSSIGVEGRFFVVNGK